MTKVIMLNGAPRSGKDTLAGLLRNIFFLRSLDADILPVKDYLVRQTREFFHIYYIEWSERYEQDKDTPWDKLFGMSQREALIWISEEVVKPKFGRDFYGKRFIEEWGIGNSPNISPNIIIIPDAGFVEEDEVIVDHFGKENCVMINTFRDGTDFSKDSRSLITGDMLGIKGYDFYNNTPIEDNKYEVKALAETILELFGLD